MNNGDTHILPCQWNPEDLDTQLDRNDETGTFMVRFLGSDFGHVPTVKDGDDSPLARWVRGERI